MISPETWELRKEVIVLLGAQCACACGCRQTALKTLQIDHINGGGNDVRKKLRGDRAYVQLKKALLAKREYPDDEEDLGLQLLCANCHFLKTQYEVCDLGYSPDRQGRDVPPVTWGNSKDEAPRHAPGVALPHRIRRNYGTPQSPFSTFPDPMPRTSPGECFPIAPSWWDHLRAWWRRLGVID
jgi:hypothetical protein